MTASVMTEFKRYSTGRKKTMNNKMKHCKYLEEHIEDLMYGRKLTYRGWVYWASTATLKIYRHSEDAAISGSILGNEYAYITEDFKKVIKTK